MHRCSYWSCWALLCRCSSMPIKAHRCSEHIYAETDSDVLGMQEQILMFLVCRNRCVWRINSSSEMHSWSCYGQKGVKLETRGMDGWVKLGSVGQIAPPVYHQPLTSGWGRPDYSVAECSHIYFVVFWWHRKYVQNHDNLPIAQWTPLDNGW